MLSDSGTQIKAIGSCSLVNEGIGSKFLITIKLLAYNNFLNKHYKLQKTHKTYFESKQPSTMFCPEKVDELEWKEIAIMLHIYNYSHKIETYYIVKAK